VAVNERGIKLHSIFNSYPPNKNNDHSNVVIINTKTLAVQRIASPCRTKQHPTLHNNTPPNKTLPNTKIKIATFASGYAILKR